MKKYLFGCFLASSLLSINFLYAQNVGIGTAAPLEKLHVIGNVRVSNLAGVGTRLVGADANGTLTVVAPGTNGQVLTQTAAGPAWGNVSGTVQVYNAYATRTSITTTTFTQITGLTQTVTLTAPATVLLNTYGSMETWSSFDGGSGTIVQLFNNGVAIANAFQTQDINDASGWTNTIQPWSFGAYLTLPAGSYTFTVRARKYAFDSFYAGGNTTAPSPNEGALTVMVIY